MPGITNDMFTHGGMAADFNKIKNELVILVLIFVEEELSIKSNKALILPLRSIGENGN